MHTTQASFGAHKHIFPGETLSGDQNTKSPTQHNWLDKNVVNDMIQNFNQKEQMMKRSALVKTAQPQKLRQGVKLRKKIDSIANG